MLKQFRSAVAFASHLPRYREILGILFKYGFALRNSGEDLLAMFARAGSGYFMQELAGRNIGNYDAYQESKKILDAFKKTGPNLRKGERLTQRQKWIVSRNYDVPTHIRPLARAASRLGIFKDAKYVIGKNYGKWLATFLRGDNRKESTLVDLMKYFRGGSDAAAKKGFWGTRTHGSDGADTI
jgi:hypothetical protein